MKSHVQIHKSWMKNFVSNIDKHKTYCLNLGENHIEDEKICLERYEQGLISISKLGIIENYYPEDMEEYLSSNYESRFGKIIKRIKQDCKSDRDKLSISDEDVDFMNRFMAVVHARGKFFQNMLSSNMSHPEYNIAPHIVVPLSVCDCKTPMFDFNSLDVLYNTSGIGFVLPSIGFYAISEFERVIPISSKIAIRFSNDKDNKVINKINIKSEILKLNRIAFETEYKINHQQAISYIIASNEQDISDILDLTKQ